MQKTADINILKSTINNLIQENKQLLESNKHLKIQDGKLRDLIKVAACELETQIQLISGWSKLLSEYYKLPQQFPNIKREDIECMILLTYGAALKLKYQTEDIKRDASRI